MDLFNKFKETAVSVLPIMAIVFLLSITIVPLEKFLIGRFLIGGFLLIIGLTIFLLGVDLGIQPMGERCGAELTKKRNLGLLLIAAFFIGFIVTAAEPDIQVFGDQVKNVFSFVSKNLLTISIAAGVGLFIMAGLFRSVSGISLKLFLLVFYIIIFALTMFVPESFIGVAFDSGGATTGPMTVPFILAMGLGVSSVSTNNKNSFGLTGICSIGPILAVLIYGFILNKTGIFVNSNNISSEAIKEATFVNAGFMTKLFSPFGLIFVDIIHESLLSIAPLFGLFILFQITLLKMTKRQVIRMIIGFVYSFLGLTIFLIGVNGGFMQAGEALGHGIGEKVASSGGVWYFVLILCGVVFGAIIVCAEPAVWVLSEQVENVSGGTIKRSMLLIFFSVGTAIAIALAMWRAVSGFDIKMILIPGYCIAMFLMIFCPDNFTGIAFDSGGVASGPLTSTFILSFTLGAASSTGAGNDSFGVIALVAMMPLIAIQIMGILYNYKSSGKKVKEIKHES